MSKRSKKPPQAFPAHREDTFMPLWQFVSYARASKRKEKAGVRFGGQTLQPQRTHGILGGLSSPAFSLKPIDLATAITLLFSGSCALSQELSECLSWNFSGSQVRSPSLVQLGAWNNSLYPYPVSVVISIIYTLLDACVVVVVFAGLGVSMVCIKWWSFFPAPSTEP